MFFLPERGSRPEKHVWLNLRLTCGTGEIDEVPPSFTLCREQGYRNRPLQCGSQGSGPARTVGSLDWLMGLEALQKQHSPQTLPDGPPKITKGWRGGGQPPALTGCSFWRFHTSRQPQTTATWPIRKWSFGVPEVTNTFIMYSTKGSAVVIVMPGAGAIPLVPNVFPRTWCVFHSAHAANRSYSTSQCLKRDLYLSVACTHWTEPLSPFLIHIYDTLRGNEWRIWNPHHLITHHTLVSEWSATPHPTKPKE